MVRRFTGEYDFKVDAKGRVSIPADFRRVIEAGDPEWTAGQAPNFVIVYGNESRQYLECYTMDSISEVYEKIGKLPRGSRERRGLEKMFSGQAVTTQVDDTGRIVLSAKLRNKLGITDSAFFIASMDTFQIWKPETYDEVEGAKEKEWLESLPEDFDPLMFLDGVGAD